MKRSQKLTSALALAAGLCLGLLVPSTLRAQAEPSPYHVARYELDIELGPDTHQLRGRAHVEVAADEPLAALTFHLNKNLRVERVAGPDNKPLHFEQQAGAETFQVDLPQVLSAGQTSALTVDYQGAFDPALRPERGALLGVIAPGKTYLLREARWFPQAANLWARFAMTLSVTLPEGETAVSSGRAEPPRTAGGKTRAVFRVDEPALVGTLVAGRYQQVKAASGAPLTFYLLTAPESSATGSADTLADIMAFFSDEFGPLENAELAVVETQDDTWESHSAPGLLLLPTRQWGSTLNQRLLARSLARQWFASRVSPANASDAWLADGLCRYAEALYIEHSAGTEGLRQALEDLTIAALVDESAAPIANAGRLTPFSPEFYSVIRDKGAMVFHMLRQVMGDEAFFRLLAAYGGHFAGRGVTLDEFERLAEETAGQPLDYFFAEWLRSTGVPQFELEYVIYRTQKGFRVGGQVKQQLEIFRMPVPVRVETEGPPATQVVAVAGPSTDFSIETFGKPTRIEIDPDYNVLKYTPALRLRVAIARGEANFERGRYFEAVRDYQQALEVKVNSSLAHYRMGEAFFEQRNYQAAANSFREAVNGDQEPKWTLVWSHLFLGKIFDITGQRERAINEYRRALETNDDTQGALAEAQKYLQEPYHREARTIEQIERR